MLTEKTFTLFQATINLLIGYEPPENATPNPNDQPDGSISHAEAGKLTINLRYFTFE